MTRASCKLNMTAFLMRITLDKSHADPAFGEPPEGPYLTLIRVSGGRAT